jgi:hypothetical protein
VYLDLPLQLAIDGDRIEFFTSVFIPRALVVGSLMS